MCEQALGRDGHVEPLHRRPILQEAVVLGNQGQRVLAFATRRLTGGNDADLDQPGEGRPDSYPGSVPLGAARPDTHPRGGDPQHSVAVISLLGKKPDVCW
jgi:hypothetical protein